MRTRRIALSLGVVVVAVGASAVAVLPASAAGGCRVVYTVSSQWPGGFGADVAVTNLGDPVNGWTLAWSFGAGQQVTQAWNATVTQSGSQVSAADVGWNGSLATNASASFGFNGSWTSTNPVPTTFTLNGVTCTGTVTSSPTPSRTSSPASSPTPSRTSSPAPSLTPSRTSSPAPSPTASPTGGAGSVTVAKDGSGNYRTVQDAINAAPANQSSTFTISIKPGDYHEIVSVPSNKPHITLSGTTGNPADVVIEYNNASGTSKPGGGTYGTSGSASVTISANDFTARHLTFANTFNEASSSLADKQAVAVNTQADRAVFDDVRFLGNQDTLLLWSSSTTTRTRAYFHACYVEGDVDFIFGRGTGVFDGCEIHSLSRGSSSNNGYVTAAATDISNPYGFLFSRCNLTSNAPAQTVYLGRPWHPSGDPNALAQVVFRESTLGAQIKSAPWTDMSGFSWQDARFDEYHNSGSGAGTGSSRPQLSDTQAPNYTPQKYLAGSDGWNPIG